MSLLLKSLSGLETIDATGLQAGQRITLITAGGFVNATWGTLFNAISDPLVQRLVILEDAIDDLTSGGGGATIWPVARTITLTGAVTGSVAMDGSQNVSMATSIADGSLTLAKVADLTTRLSTLDTQVSKFWGTGFTAGPQPSGFTGDANLITGATFLSAVTGTATNIPNEAGGNYMLLTNGPTNTGQQLALRNGEGWIRGQVSGVWSSWNKLWTSANLNPANLLLKTDTATAATKLATARALSLTGVITAAGVNFDGTANVALTTAIADAALTIAKTSGLQTALDARLQFRGSITAGVALNTITASGIYTQTTAAEVTTAKNYPQASAVGYLRVWAQGAYVQQEYLTTTNVFYRRIYDGSSWTAWTKAWTALDFDPTTKLDKTGGEITGQLIVNGALIGYNTVTGSYYMSTQSLGDEPNWLLLNSSSLYSLGLEASATGVSLRNDGTMGGGTNNVLKIHNSGGLTFNDHAVYHAGNFTPDNPVPAGGLLNIGDPGAAHLSFRYDGKYSTDGGFNWRDINEAPQAVTEPRFTTVKIGSDDDLMLYESSAGELSIRSGSSSAYNYFTFNANGNFSVLAGRVMISGNEAWHAGNFDPATKLGVSATAAAATKLATARTINGVNFDGTANITIPFSVGDSPTFTGTTLFDVNNGSTGKLRIIAGDGTAANGVHLDSINDTGSAFAPLNLRGTTITLNGNTAWTNATFDPNSKLNNRGSLGIVAHTVNDWNTALDSGWYMGTAAANAPAAIGNNWFMVRVLQHNGDWIQQEGYIFTEGAETIRYRRHRNAGTWGAWTTTQNTGAIYANADGNGSTIYASGPANTQHGGYAISWGGARQYQLGIDSDGTFRLWTYTAAGGFQTTGMVMSREGRVTFGAGIGADDFNKLTVQGGIKSRGGSATLGIEERDNTAAEWNIYATGGILRFWRGGNGDRAFIGSDGAFSATRISAGWDSGTSGAISCNNWFRTSGQTGIYFSDYAGGWYMTDTTYVRSYNNRPVAASDYVISSDKRLKEDLGPLTLRRRLRPKVFRWLESGELDFGFFAQDVEEDYPEAVGEIEKQYGSLLQGEMIKQLSYQKLVAVVAAQTNDNSDDIDVLKQDLLTMRAELEQLKQLVADLTRSQ